MSKPVAVNRAPCTEHGAMCVGGPIVRQRRKKKDMRCGESTRTGQPCPKRLPCSTHTTELGRALIEALKAVA